MKSFIVGMGKGFLVVGLFAFFMTSIGYLATDNAYFLVLAIRAGLFSVLGWVILKLTKVSLN